MLHTVRRI